MNATGLGYLQFAATAAVNLGAALLAGGLAALWMLGESDSRESASDWAGSRRRRIGALARFALCWQLAAIVVLFWVQAAVAAEVPLSTAAASLGMVLLHTHVGRASGLGAAALLALACVWRPRPSRPPTRRSLTLASASLALFAAARSSAGHAGAGAAMWPIVCDWLHVCGASVWAGLVFVAAGIVLRGPMPAAPAERAECVAFVQALSAVATGALATVAVSGTVSAWRGLGGTAASPAASSYGQILLVKLLFVTGAVVLGAANRWLVMPRVSSSCSLADDPSAVAWQTFRRVLAVESVALLAVLALAAALALSAPPATP